jgi:hypothetical protein
MAVGFPAKTTYANGDVFSASDINDTNGTLNLVNPATNASGQSNPVINSAFQVWQRGTSIAGSGSAYLYTADRWQTEASTSLTISRQATSDTTNLPFIQYCARVQRNSGSTATAAAILAQSFETTNSIPYAGKTVTFSFYARRGANFSGASNQLNAYLVTGTGTDQNVFVGGYTGAVNAIAQTPTLTTTWQRFSYSATLATNQTELGLQFFYTPSGTAGAADYYEVTGVQLDVGSTATPFRTYAATIQEELAACQRYYVRFGGASNYDGFARGNISSSTQAQLQIDLPVEMRIPATVIDYSNIAYVGFGWGSVIAITAITVNFGSTKKPNLVATSSSTSYTTGTYVVASSNNTTAGYLGLSAEL